MGAALPAIKLGSEPLTASNFAFNPSTANFAVSKSLEFTAELYAFFSGSVIFSAAQLDISV